MLSDNFKTLLTIEEERLVAMRNDCAPFAEGDDMASQVHHRAITDIDLVLDLTRAFRAANPPTTREKQIALRQYDQVSKTTMELSAYLFSNSHCAGQFRNAALQKHAAMLNTIAREQVLTCVNTGWALIEEICGSSKAPQQLPKPLEISKNVVLFTPRPRRD